MWELLLGLCRSCFSRCCSWKVELFWFRGWMRAAQIPLSWLKICDAATSSGKLHNLQGPLSGVIANYSQHGFTSRRSTIERVLKCHTNCMIYSSNPKTDSNTYCGILLVISRYSIFLNLATLGNNHFFFGFVANAILSPVFAVRNITFTSRHDPSWVDEIEYHESNEHWQGVQGVLIWLVIGDVAL